MSLFDSLRSSRDALELPLVYVRDGVVFPNTLSPVLAATKFSIAAVEEASKGERRIAVFLLRKMPEEGDSNIDVHEIGTIAHVIQTVRMGDGSSRLLVEGERRVRLKRTIFKKEYLSALVEPFEPESAADEEVTALLGIIKRDFSSYADLAKKVPSETVQTVFRTDAPERLCDIVAHAMALKSDRKQELLGTQHLKARLELTASFLATEIESLSLQKKITQKVRARIDKGQKDYFLQEQLKEINRELGRGIDENDDISDLEQRIVRKDPPLEVIEKSRKELARLGKLQTLSPEAGVLRTYCEWLADLPWSETKEDNKDISVARGVLEEDHYGMKRAKERILEFIAVRQLNAKLKGPILCFVGPPGTGKTSLGRSVARALGRDFVRMSLGGVRDEAEIRGHRKTYVGALPGKIIQSMKKAGSVNPVILLDEIDKMSSDFRGDPASALLEVLDPEQNSTFTDHYLELAYDLSGVMFITTANGIHTIPYPLLDRMEIIEIPGYSEFEKLEIAKRFIVPKQLAENGLREAGVRFRDDAILEIIRYYTMESGVRSLEREIARVIRKTAKKAVEEGYASIPERIREFRKIIRKDSIQKLLGKRKHEDDIVFVEQRIGVANGLAWTELGGTLLPVESSSFEGPGELILTGNLGDVMKESARAALTFIESRAGEYGLQANDFRKKTLHVHVPEGAIPKDGPSAGITLAASLLSTLTGIPLLPGWAMTGEITLTGRVLAIGGVKEKVLAAHRAKMKHILLPEANRKDLDDIPQEVFADMEFTFAVSAADAFAFLFPGQLSERSGIVSRSPRPARVRTPSAFRPRTKRSGASRKGSNEEAGA